jgi:hypothetical protein
MFLPNRRRLWSDPMYSLLNSHVTRGGDRKTRSTQNARPVVVCSPKVSIVFSFSSSNQHSVYSCATTGEGLFEGLQWLSQNVKKRQP